MSFWTGIFLYRKILHYNLYCEIFYEGIFFILLWIIRHMHTTIVTDMSKTGCLDMFDNIARLINGRIDLELSCSASCWTRLHDTYNMNSHRGMIARPWLFLHLLYIYTPSAITVIVLVLGHLICLEGTIYELKTGEFTYAYLNIC